MYLGNIPATSFEAVKKDRFTSLTGTGVTLSHSVSNVQDIVVWVNNVKQDYNNYTVSGTALTLGGSLVSADVVQVLYVGRTLQTVNPAADSVGSSQVASTLITGQTAETSIATDDLILLSDTSASGALRKMTRANFVSGIGGTNTPAFAATAAGNAISADTYTKAQNGTELLDTDSCYDNSSNYRFTPNVAGKYFLSNRISVNPDSNMQYIRAAIYKNGSSIAEMQKIFNNTDPIGNSHFSMELNMISEANGSSDYFEAFAYLQQNGDYLNTSGGNLFLGYKLIGA